MAGEMNIYYDQEGDFLEIQIGELTECYYQKVLEFLV